MSVPRFLNSVVQLDSFHPLAFSFLPFESSTSSKSECARGTNCDACGCPLALAQLPSDWPSNQPLSLHHKHRAWMLLKTLSLKDLSSVYIFSSVLTITCKTDPFARLMTPLPPSLPPLRVLQLGGRSVLSYPLYWIQQWAKLSFLYQSGSTKCLCLALMLCIHCVTWPQWHWTLEVVFALWFSAFYLSSCGLKRSTSSPEQRSDSGQCLLGLSFYY